MPLSKERMRERKRQDRNVKPDCLIVKPDEDVIFPPKSTTIVKGIVVERRKAEFATDYPQLDADGNVIPEVN